MIGQLDLVTLLVRDVAASKRFYADVLGLDVAKESGGYVELRSGQVRLALYPRKALSELLGFSEPEGAAIDLSFVVEDVDGAFETLVDRGAEPLRAPATMPWGHRAAFFLDPDGYLVEIVQKDRVL